MNNQLSSYFSNAQLSQAAYANFGASTSIIQDLIDAGFTQSQANEFVNENRYTIVDQYIDPDSGFSGTVFLDNETNSHVFAMRGTDFSELADLLADASLALSGYAGEQVLSMVNYYFRLITSEGDSAPQYELVQESGTLLADNSWTVPSEPYILISPGVLPPPDGGINPTPPEYLVLREGDSILVNQNLLSSSESLTISGHSLGGHLVSAFSRLFPGVINQGFTYNGAGINAGPGEGFDIFANLLSNITQPVAINPGAGSDNNITNIIAKPGVEFVPATGELIGSQELFFIEAQTIGLNNHRIRHLTDALAVYNLMESLDPDITTVTATEILYNSSNNPGESLERFLNAIVSLYDTTTTVGINDRDQLYQALNEIDQVAGTDLSFTSLANTPAATLAVRCKEPYN